MLEILIRRYNMFHQYYELDRAIKASKRPNPAIIKEMERLALEIEEELSG